MVLLYYLMEFDWMAHGTTSRLSGRSQGERIFQSERHFKGKSSVGEVFGVQPGPTQITGERSELLIYLTGYTTKRSHSVLRMMPQSAVRFLNGGRPTPGVHSLDLQNFTAGVEKRAIVPWYHFSGRKKWRKHSGEVTANF